MSFFVYILQCADGSYYTGHTDAIESRLDEHVTGTNFSYTKDRLPFTLVFLEEFGTREEAFAAESGIKKMVSSKEGSVNCKKLGPIEATVKKTWWKIKAHICF